MPGRLAETANPFHEPQTYGETLTAVLRELKWTVLARKVMVFSV